MTPAQQKRIRRRIHRLEARLAWNRKLRAAFAGWQENKHGPVRAFIKELVADNPEISDAELIEELIEKIDELRDFEGLRETISDIGIHLFVHLAVAVVQRTPDWLDRRAERLEARIRELRESLAAPSGRRGVPGEEREGDASIFAELGFDDAFVA